MGTYTTNKNLFMPTVGETGWGTLVNGNFETIDNFLKPITVSGSTYTFTGNQTGGTITATKITNSGTLTQTGTSTFTGKITGNGGIGTKALSATSISNSGNMTNTGTFTSTGKIYANGGIEVAGDIAATSFNGVTLKSSYTVTPTENYGAMYLTEGVYIISVLPLIHGITYSGSLNLYKSGTATSNFNIITSFSNAENYSGKNSGIHTITFENVPFLYLEYNYNSGVFALCDFTLS